MNHPGVATPSPSQSPNTGIRRLLAGTGYSSGTVSSVGTGVLTLRLPAAWTGPACTAAELPRTLTAVTDTVWSTSTARSDRVALAAVPATVTSGPSGSTRTTKLSTSQRAVCDQVTFTSPSSSPGAAVTVFGAGGRTAVVQASPMTCCSAALASTRPKEAPRIATAVSCSAPRSVPGLLWGLADSRSPAIPATAGADDEVPQYHRSSPARSEIVWQNGAARSTHSPADESESRTVGS